MKNVFELMKECGVEFPEDKKKVVEELKAEAKEVQCRRKQQ